MDIGEKEEGKASGGSFVRSAGKRPRTKDDDEDDWGSRRPHRQESSMYRTSEECVLFFEWIPFLTTKNSMSIGLISDSSPGLQRFWMMPRIGQLLAGSAP